MKIVIFFAVFTVSIIFGSYIVPRLRKLKMAGHAIREDGPATHHKKQGTPLMGGMIFLGTSFLSSLIYSIVTMDFRILFIAVFVVLFGFIGFLDDYIKIIKKDKNGMRSKQKFIMLTTVSALFVITAYFTDHMDGSLVIPVLGFGYYFNLGILMIPFGIFILLAATNAVNLTDGIDGLAGSVTSIVLLTYIVITSLKSDWSYINIFLIILFAGVVAFLYFNYHPAKVFMGDSGALALGGGIGIAALLTKTSLVLPVIGIVYFVETISVILQVIYFKKTKKRLFKMSPIHHHFELKGWSENKIVIIFSLVTVAACIGGIYLLGIRPF